MATDAAREARRRRLLDRGSDRLAFITGQPHYSAPAASQESPQQEVDLKKNHKNSQNETPIVVVRTPEEKQKAYEIQPSTYVLNKEVKETVDEHADVAMSNNVQANSGLAEEMATQVVLPSSQQNHSTRTAPASPTGWHQLISCGEISRAISASETKRLISAVVMALLVVMGLIRSSPLFLLMLADISIVVGLLIMRNGKTVERRSNDGSPVDNVSRLLEIGLLVQQAVAAVSLDCALCAVIMISLAQF